MSVTTMDKMETADKKETEGKEKNSAGKKELLIVWKA